MKLYIRRQIQMEKQGFLRGGGEVQKFLLYARVELTPEEAKLVDTYQLGRYFIWERSDAELQEFIKNKKPAVPQTIFLSSLTGQGTTRDFDSFVIMLNAEDHIKNSVKGFASLLKEADTFEAEEVVEF
jgi:hypothetical protein